MNNSIKFLAHLAQAVVIIQTPLVRVMVDPSTLYAGAITVTVEADAGIVASVALGQLLTAVAPFEGTNIKPYVEEFDENEDTKRIVTWVGIDG